MWGYMKLTNYVEIFENDKWWVQYPVIYAFFRVWIVIASAIIVQAWLRQKEERRGSEPF